MFEGLARQLFLAAGLRFVGKSNGPGETGGPLLVVYSPDVASNMLHHKFPGSVTSRLFGVTSRTREYI